jgi:hypothetical protein
VSALDWGLIHDGGVLESLMHTLLYAEDPQTMLFGRKGNDAVKWTRLFGYSDHGPPRTR